MGVNMVKTFLFTTGKVNLCRVIQQKPTGFSQPEILPSLNFREILTCVEKNRKQNLKSKSTGYTCYYQCKKLCLNC